VYISAICSTNPSCNSWLYPGYVVGCDLADGGVSFFFPAPFFVGIFGVEAPVLGAASVCAPGFLGLRAPFTERVQDTMVCNGGGSASDLNALVSTLYLECPGAVLLLGMVGGRYCGRCGRSRAREHSEMVHDEAQLLIVGISQSDW
jgi:hypothetical protein